MATTETPIKQPAIPIKITAIPTCPKRPIIPIIINVKTYITHMIALALLYADIS